MPPPPPQTVPSVSRKKDDDDSNCLTAILGCSCMDGDPIQRRRRDSEAKPLEIFFDQNAGEKEV